tara:strand:+ start:980 stop:1237 length:258 start_codon:yes stop_codon:yes gene_type:complete
MENVDMENTDIDIELDMSDPLFQENVSIYDDFFEQIDKSIITGDINYIQDALKMYGNQLNVESVRMATRIVFEILEERMVDISLD